MQLNFAKKLDLHIRKTNVDAQKINSSRLKVLGMVIAFFLIENNHKSSCFFEEIFLLADISVHVAFEIFFLILSNVEVNLINQELRWRLYTTAKIRPPPEEWNRLVRKSLQLQFLIKK